MSRPRQFPFVDPDGVRGIVLTGSRFLDNEREKLIRLQDGQEFFVGSNLLQPIDDNSYRLTVPAQSLIEAHAGVERISAGNSQHSAGKEVVIPAIEEQLRVEKQTVATGSIRIQKHVDKKESVVDEPLIHQTWDVERVPVNRIIDGAFVEPRYEGDTLVLPVLEEVLVVEKRLVLREEMRITRRRSEVREPQTHTVRQERLEVERVH
ncbi:MAG: YsnF/AvaK domain-containing protein [Bryobacteraceae bacterium]|nr:YsnF/AvaK domain-containing protein [Bryobacteraceae bacterium]